MVASSRWKRKSQGDGLAAYSTGTSDLFTSNGGLGYTTIGNWHTGGANSLSNAKAYVHLAELARDGVTPTGREVIFQRGSGTAAGNDRNVNVVFSVSALTVSGSASAAPTGGQMLSGGAINGAGGNIWNRLATSPQIGGSGGTIYSHYWIGDNTTDYEGVAPFGVVVYDGTAGEPAWQFFYEAVVTSADSSDPHPFAVMGLGQSTSNWESQEALTDLSNTYFTTASQQMWSVSPAGALTLSGINRITTPDATVRPGGANALTPDADSKFSLLPAIVWTDVATNSACKGALETIELLLPTSTTYFWPTRFHSAVADAVEPARLSIGALTLRWVVGEGQLGSGVTSNNRTDVRRLVPLQQQPGSAPTLEDVTPSDGSTIDPDDTVTLEFSDDTDEVSVAITYTTGSTPHTETVYAGGQSFDPYVVDDSTAGVLEISRSPGWPGDADITVVLVGSGQRVVEALSYSISEYLPTAEASP